MHKLAPILIVLAGCSCSAPTAEPIGDAAEPGLHHGTGPLPPSPSPQEALAAWLETHSGPCRDACVEVLDGVCADECSSAWALPSDEVTCGDQTLTCAQARAAGRGDTTGLSLCWRSCEGLH
jgi:hypothetical protein